MTLHRTIWITCAVCVGLLIEAPSAEGANCSLRNPDRQIYEIFPNATSYRSIVANVDEGVKPAIESLLGSAVTFNDLAKHTIYVVLSNEVPIGFIHPRSEIGEHGTVELIWALDLDLKVRDFRVQRCREKRAEAIENKAFRDAVVGRDHRQLRELLLENNTRVNTAKLAIAAGDEPIAHTALLCGTKTLIITETAFGDQLLPLRLLGNVHRFFPDATRVTKLSSPLNESARAAAHSLLGSPISRIGTDSVTVARAISSKDEPLGAVVRCQCAGLPQAELWSVINGDGTLREALIVGPVGAGDSGALACVRGKQLADLSSAGEVAGAGLGQCAMEVLAVLAAQAPQR